MHVLSAAAEAPLRHMDLTVIWQQVFSSNTSLSRQAEAWLLQSWYDLGKEELRKLVAGFLADVRRQISGGKLAG